MIEKINNKSMKFISCFFLMGVCYNIYKYKYKYYIDNLDCYCISYKKCIEIIKKDNYNLLSGYFLLKKDGML